MCFHKNYDPHKISCQSTEGNSISISKQRWNASMDLFKRRLEFLFIPTGTFQPAIDDLNVLTVIWEPEASKSEKKKAVVEAL